MRVIRFLLNLERSAMDRLHFHPHLRLPFASRLLHWRTARHALAILIGSAIASTGSYLAVNHEIAHHIMPVWLWDFGAYSIHAIGLGPILAHVEPFWKIIMGR